MEEIIYQKKQEIRKKYKEKRNALTDEQVQEWSERICQHLKNMELFQQAEIIFFYYPLGNEVDLLSVAQTALEMGKVVGFPKTEGDVIRFYLVKSLADFTTGCFQVKEPMSQQCFSKQDVKGKKFLILTPGVAFDEKKNRMGYGRGYYDKYVAEFPEAVKIGVAYEMQIDKELPVEECDIPMEYLVTNLRVL